MYKITEKQLKDDLPRALHYANQDKELEQMCRNCEEWCGKEHDYSECLDKMCFTFYRAFNYLEFANTFPDIY